MKLIEIKEMSTQGTYFGVRPTKETITAMREFMGDYKIPNPVADHDLHSTVVYSRAFVGAQPLGKLDPTWKAKFHEYDLFPSSPLEEAQDEKEPTQCLVMKFHCPEVTDRHNYLRKHHGATHDFSSFDPHMTLSYNVGNFDHHNLAAYDGPHEFEKEYSEPLNPNGWKK